MGTADHSIAEAKPSQPSHLGHVLMSNLQGCNEAYMQQPQQDTLKQGQGSVMLRCYSQILRIPEPNV
jgi:hypothetical protein